MKSRILALALLTICLGACGGKEERAATYLERAQAAFDQGDYIKAQLDAKNALQIMPNDFEASYLLAEIAEKENRPQEMVAFLRRSVEIDPSNVEAQVKMGRIWAASQQLDRARESLNAIQLAEPDNLEGKVLEGIILVREGDVERGRALADEVLLADPRNISALSFLASTYRSEDLDKALELLDQAINYEPDNQSLRVVKVNILQSEQRFAEAEKELRDLIVRFPEENAFRYALARYLSAQSRNADALAVLQDLVQADPENLTAKLTLAQFMAQSDTPGDAVALLEGYIEQEPEIYQFRFALGQTHAAMQDFDKARAVFRDIMERDGLGVNGLAARTKLAAIELTRGDRALGEALITEVLDEEPANSDALAMRASVALNEGRNDDAIGDLRNVLRADPTRENAQLLLGRAHVASGQNALAIEAYQNLVDTHPRNLDARKELARLLAIAGRWDDVRELLAVGIVQSPKDLAMARLYIDALLRGEDWDAAEAQAQRILDLDPTKALGHYVRGRVLQARGAFRESIDALQVAIDINPDAAESLTAIVRSFVRLEDIDGAVAYLENFVQNNPDNVHGVSLLGEVQARAGDWSKAEQSNLRALDMQEAWLPAYRNLVGIYLREDQTDKAEAIIERGLVAAPKNSELLLLQANLREQSGRFLEAIDNYEQILENNPSLAVAANNYIALIADHRNDAQSLEKAAGYTTLFENSDNPIFQDTLGWLYYRQGRYQDALELLERAVDRAGQLAQLRYHLGMTYFQLDRLDDARRELEAALDGDQLDYAGVDVARETLSKLR